MNLIKGDFASSWRYILRNDRVSTTTYGQDIKIILTHTKSIYVIIFGRITNISIIQDKLLIWSILYN